MTRAQHLIYCKVAGKRTPHDELNLVRRSSRPGPLRIEVALAEDVTLAKSVPRHQTAAKLFTLLHFVVADRAAATSECRNDVLPFPHDRPHLLGISGNRMTPTRHVLIQGEMLFDHAR